MIHAEYIKSIEEELTLCALLKQESFSNIDNELYVFERIIALEEKLAKTTDPNLINLYITFLAHIYNELGSFISDFSYLSIAEIYFNRINYEPLLDSLKYETIFRRGRNFLGKYKIKKNDIRIKSKYEIIKKYLFPALQYVQNAFREGVVDNKIISPIIRRYILIHMADVTVNLNRWTEFQYYLNFIPDVEKDSAFHILRAVTLDAYAKNTHSSITPELLQEILISCWNSINDQNVNQYNKRQAINILMEYSDLANKYGLSFSIDPNLKIDFASLNHINPKFVHTKYRKWCLENNLALNEHSLFCTCQLASQDNLKLRTNHKHTHKKWLINFQFLID